jgi:hypothetical protein
VWPVVGAVAVRPSGSVVSRIMVVLLGSSVIAQLCNDDTCVY